MTACYMWAFVEESEKGCVFGRGLEEHLKATGRDVAFVLEECIGFLLAHLDEEVRHVYATPARFTNTCTLHLQDLDTPVHYTCKIYIHLYATPARFTYTCPVCS